MSLDIKYRPRVYSDVLGQDSTIEVLRQYVIQGRGFRQSYLFCGGHGSGKTTLGRILARALLCESPVNGEPCDSCVSCQSMLVGETHMDFVEVDAATHSGKADVKAITDLIQYATFSGKRRIYLFDESHQLSKDALDALLKPMEDNFPGSEDKKLVCIFCTTEPEKMRSTVLSRCAPAFIIKPQSPETIGSRLEWICTQEGIAFEPGMLQLIAEATECHIRDALKAVEGVSMLGGITRQNVESYLHMDLNDTFLEMISLLGTDLQRVMTLLHEVSNRVSPVSAYEKLSEIALLCYRAYLGDKVPAYCDVDKMKQVGISQVENLLIVADKLASRPNRPTYHMLMMDLAHLHYGDKLVSPVRDESVRISSTSTPQFSEPSPEVVSDNKQEVQKIAIIGGKIDQRDAGWVNATNGPAASKPKVGSCSIEKRTVALDFASLLKTALSQVGGHNGGPTGHNNLGSG